MDGRSLGARLLRRLLLGALAWSTRLEIVAGSNRNLEIADLMGNACSLKKIAEPRDCCRRSTELKTDGFFCWWVGVR